MSESSSSDAVRAAHPNYVGIWVILLALFGASVGAAYLGATRTATLLIFGIAITKALLVISYYMHLRFEPRWIVILMLGALACATVLFFGLIPDIVYVYGG
ncbi:MAG: cytochrome C oxidase subunit IV family protein [Candidatus Latescibacterota bacterium]|nr:MAG: cytochrome C oxidase subunit IV family protein [Candidatus Latescibacterota bacterium]